jgi:hypothetical protein
MPRHSGLLVRDRAGEVTDGATPNSVERFSSQAGRGAAAQVASCSLASARSTVVKPSVNVA